MALPAIRARRRAATAIWPGWPRRAWMRGVERGVRALQRIDRQGAGGDPGGEDGLGREQAGQGQGGRTLGAVQ
jgi:hypothetical protein